MANDRLRRLSDVEAEALALQAAAFDRFFDATLNVLESLPRCMFCDHPTRHTITVTATQETLSVCAECEKDRVRE